MATDLEEEEAYKAAFLNRTRMLREARGWSQAKMALHLGISLDRYKKYEKRSPLPHYLVWRFADLVGRDIEFIMTGKQRAR